MQVSYNVSIRVLILVQDRISYDLHNTREIMIMQMRDKAGMFSKRVLKEDLLETASDSEITKRLRSKVNIHTILRRDRYRDWQECCKHKTKLK